MFVTVLNKLEHNKVTVNFFILFFYVIGNVFMPFQGEIVLVGKIDGNRMIMIKVKLSNLCKIKIKVIHCERRVI